MKYVNVAFLFSTLLLVGCAKVPETVPPIQIVVIAPAVTTQFVNELGDRLVKVGKVQYHASGGFLVGRGILQN